MHMCLCGCACVTSSTLTVMKISWKQMNMINVYLSMIVMLAACSYNLFSRFLSFIYAFPPHFSSVVEIKFLLKHEYPSL